MNRKKHEEQKDSILEPVAPTPSVSEEDGDSSASTDRELRQIVETGSITVDKRGHYIHCLTVIGQIEGHYVLPAQNKTTKYEHVIPQLVAIEESRDIEGLLIILNTVGAMIAIIAIRIYPYRHKGRFKMDLSAPKAEKKETARV